MGSVRQFIDTSSNVKNWYIYGPFGNIFAAETTETAENAFTFTGQWYDEEIGQYYLRARMYDPQLYRFTARDPYQGDFKEPLTLHAYLYCLNNPINSFDPTGEMSTLVEQLLVSSIRGTLLGTIGGGYCGLLKSFRTGNIHDIWKGAAAGAIGGAAGGAVSAWLGTTGVLAQGIGGAVGGGTSHIAGSAFARDFEHFWAELGAAVLIGGVTSGLFEYSGAGEAIASTGIKIKDARTFIQAVEWTDPLAAEVAGVLIIALEELWDSAGETFGNW